MVSEGERGGGGNEKRDGEGEETKSTQGGGVPTKERKAVETHSIPTPIPNVPNPTIGSKQYPSTLAVRYASIPRSDMRLRSV